MPKVNHWLLQLLLTKDLEIVSLSVSGFHDNLKHDLTLFDPSQLLSQIFWKRKQKWSTLRTIVSFFLTWIYLIFELSFGFSYKEVHQIIVRKQLSFYSNSSRCVCRIGKSGIASRKSEPVMEKLDYILI